MRHNRPSDLVRIAAKLDLPACAACGVILRPQAARGMARRWCSASCRSWRARHADPYSHRVRAAAGLDVETLEALAAWAAGADWVRGGDAAALLRLIGSTQFHTDPARDRRRSGVPVAVVGVSRSTPSRFSPRSPNIT